MFGASFKSVGQCPPATYVVGSQVGISKLSDAPPALQNLTGGSVEIRGSFAVDLGSTWRLKGVDVFFSDASGAILVNGNCTLYGEPHPVTKQPTRFYPCFGVEKWLGINVAFLGTIFLDNCRVERACTGVYLNASSKATLTNNLFLDNFYGVHIFGNAMLLGEGIAHNQIIASSALVSSCAGNESIGIRLGNVGYLVIGDMAQTGSSNDIRGYHWGIQASNSNFDMYNTTFLNGSSAIRLVDGNGIKTANLVGLGSDASDAFTIRNFTQKGVNAENYNFSVEKMKMGNLQLGIQVFNSSIPTSMIAKDNYFESYYQAGIELSTSIFNDFLIQNSEFVDDFSPVDYRYGARLTGITITSLSTSANINTSKFYDNPKVHLDPLVFNEHVGVHITGSPHAKVYNNEFFQNYDPENNNHGYYGVRLQGSGYSNIAGNNFFGMNGASNPVNNFEYQGAYNTASPNCLFSCNYAETLNKGFAFLDAACNGAIFKFNEMNGSSSDLYLAPGTIIGKQDDRKNKWPMGSPIEALFDGNPNSTALLASEFVVRDPNMNSEFWPNPVMPATGWFKPDSPNPPGLPQPCVNDPEGGGGEGGGQTAGSQMVINETFEPYLGYPATVWDMQLYAFNEMLENPAWITANAANSDFYNQHVSGNVGKLQTAKRDWEQIALFDPAFEITWKDNQSDIDTKFGEIRTQAELMQQSVSAVQQEQISQNISILTGELEALQQLKSVLATQYAAARNSRANQLIADLAEITTASVWEYNLKTVLTFNAQRLLSNANAWSAAQLAELQAIAAQCRHEGGVGVILARTAIDNFQFDDQADCPGYGQYRTAKLSDQIDGKVFPNPATEACVLNFEKPVSGELQLVDIHGQQVLNRQLNLVQSVQLDTRGLADGLYFVTLKGDGLPKWHSKITVSH